MNCDIRVIHFFVVPAACSDSASSDSTGHGFNGRNFVCQAMRRSMVASKLIRDRVVTAPTLL